jgi:hypothetical protein
MEGSLDYDGRKGMDGVMASSRGKVGVDDCYVRWECCYGRDASNHSDYELVGVL